MAPFFLEKEDESQKPFTTTQEKERISFKERERESKRRDERI